MTEQNQHILNPCSTAKNVLQNVYELDEYTKPSPHKPTISVIGLGYVGAVTSACFSKMGYSVIGVDSDKKKVHNINSGISPIFEEGLEKDIQLGLINNKLSATHDIIDAIFKSDITIISVGTPSDSQGGCKLTALEAVCREIGMALRQKKEFHTVIFKSTVPPSTTEEKLLPIIELYSGKERGRHFGVCFNPEFLREGSAIEDFKRPDRVVVGAETERAFDVMRQLYRPLNLNETPMLCTERRTSELTKYAANAFLATKITFINEIADLCESVGADVQQVAKGIGLDGRIGAKFLHAGPGYGGSCFPKDTLALLKTAEDFASPMNIVKATVETNNNRKVQMAQKILNAIGDVKGKKLAILGVTFKPNTDDMRDAPSLDIIPALLEAGALVHAYDPEGIEEAKPLLPGVRWETNAQDTLRDAEALVILTEWNEFRALDLGQIKEMLARPLIIDLRNIYAIREMQDAGIAYHSIGRPAV